MPIRALGGWGWLSCFCHHLSLPCFICLLLTWLRGAVPQQAAGGPWAGAEGREGPGLCWGDGDTGAQCSDCWEKPLWLPSGVTRPSTLCLSFLFCEVGGAGPGRPTQGQLSLGSEWPDTLHHPQPRHRPRGLRGCWGRWACQATRLGSRPGTGSRAREGCGCPTSQVENWRPPTQARRSTNPILEVLHLSHRWTDRLGRDWVDAGWTRRRKAGSDRVAPASSP